MAAGFPYDTKIDTEMVEHSERLGDHVRMRLARVVAPINYHLTSAQRAYLERVFPQFRLAPVGPIRAAQHPVLNASRQLGEAAMWEYAENKFDFHVVGSVGGNPNREMAFVRPHPRLPGAVRRIHCCNPLLDQADLVRAAVRPFGAGVTSCRHRAEVCQCVVPDLWVSSHSLYYLTPAIVYTITRRSKLGVFLATVHPCFAPYGVLGEDGWYLRQADDTIKFFASGASFAYQHPNINWLRQGGYHVDGHTLAWNFVQYNELSLVVVFVVRRGIFPLSAIDDVPRNEPVDEATCHRLGLTRLEKFAQDYFGVQPDKCAVYIPGGIIDYLRVQATGKPRSKEVWQQLVGDAKRAYKEARIPLAVCSTSITAAASLAYTTTLATDIQALEEVHSYTEQLNLYNALITFGPRQVTPFWCYASVAIALAFTRTRRVLPFVRVPVRWAAWATLGGLLLGMAIRGNYLLTLLRTTRAAAQSACVAARDHHRRITAAEFEAFYELGAPAPTQTCVQLLDALPRLPSYPPALPYEEIMAKPIDGTAVIVVRNEPRPIVRNNRPITVYGIVNTMNVMPGTYDRSRETYMAMLRSRMLIPSMKANPDYDDDLVQVWYWYHRQHREVMFGADGAAVPLDPNDWIDKYPEHQRKFLSREQIRAYYGDEDCQYNTSIFVKSELYAKVLAPRAPGVHGWAGTRPRGIQAARTNFHLNVVGSVLGFQNHLKQFLHPNQNKPWVIPCGASPEQMGAAFERDFLEKDIEESDDSNFDTHQEEDPLTMNAETIVAVCPTPHAFEHLMAAGPTTAYIKDMYKVMMKRWSVHSGHLWTYVVNCMTMISRKTFLRALWEDHSSCIFCRRPGSTFPYDRDCILAFRVWWQRDKHRGRPDCKEPPDDEKKVPSLSLLAGHEAAPIVMPKLMSPMDVAKSQGWRLFVSGDDSLEGSIPGRGPTEEFSTHFSRRLAYDCRSKIFRGPDAQFLASFCSGLFWPTSSGYILGAKLGRWFCRQGWWVDCPNWSRNSMEKMLHGDAVSRFANCRFIPFLRVYWRRILEMLKDKPMTTTFDRRYEDWIPNTTPAEPCEATWRMLNVRYGLTPQHEAEYECLLDTVPTLPAVVNFAPFSRAFMVDVIEDEADEPLY